MNTGTHDYDVVIVGYGPVGVTAANLLGGMGVRVAVVEREAAVYPRARAISTDDEVIRIWQRIGLAERLKQDMLPHRPIDFVDADGRSFLSLAPAPRDNGHPPQAFIYQPALEQALRDGVRRYPNVEVLLGHDCEALTQDGDGVEITVRNLSDDTVRSIRGGYVIAADGGSSRIRSHFDVGFVGRTYEDRWVVIDTKVHRGWDSVDRLRFHCDPARPAVDCPTPLGHHRWEFPVLPGEDEQTLVSHDYIWQLLRRYGRTPDDVEILRAVVYSHHVRFAARWRVGRVFLAGDAAHVMPPWIGEGMASGVRDVANLCWKLAAVLRGELLDDVLDSYEAERQPHVHAMTRQAVRFGRIITERRRTLTALRNIGFRAAMRIRLVRTYLQEAGWFPDTCLPARPDSVARYPVRRSAGSCPSPGSAPTTATGHASTTSSPAGGHCCTPARRHRARPGPRDRAARLRVLPPGPPPPRARLSTQTTSSIPWMRRHRAGVLAVRTRRHRLRRRPGRHRPAGTAVHPTAPHLRHEAATPAAVTAN
jgi:3-(3-hydroxy-phenyl)propionate hydroxylase